MRKMKIEQKEMDFVGGLDILSVVENEIGQLRKSGAYYECLCPFHHDNKRGNFKVTPSKGRFKCFACGVGGDKIDFVQKLYDLSFEDAVHHISHAFGYSGSDSDLSAPKAVEKTGAEKQVRKKGSPATLNGVYEAFYAASDKLTPRLRRYLEQERHLTPPQMRDFFAFPSWHDERFWASFERELTRRNLSLSATLMVPGFYIKKEPRCYSFVGYRDSYGMLCRNTEGRIVGVQIGFYAKLDDKDNDRPKYLWFSSGNVEDRDYGTMGTASGAPYDISYPGEGIQRFPSIAITEGKYKALAFANTGMPTINIHGVSNLRNLKNQVADLAKKMGTTPAIVIGLDADIFQNCGVAAAAKQIAGFFLPTHKVYIAYWDIALGKGFDDLVNNGHYDMVQKMRADLFIKQYIDPLLEKEKEENH